jgi:CRP-like cAMP-binding protein
MSFVFGQLIVKVRDPPSGIYIVVAGMVKVTYDPTPELEEERRRHGKIPNMELYTDLTFSVHEEDYFSSGLVIGEAGSLTGAPSACSIIAETSVVVYHIPAAVISQALKTYSDPFDSLESQMWRSVGIRRATPLIASLPQYEVSSTKSNHVYLTLPSVIINALFPNIGTDIHRG